MPKSKISSKHLQIDKANQFVLIVASISVVVIVFGLFIGKAMLTQRNHQARVIAEKEKALKQLEENVEAKEQIVSSYRTFMATETNIIKGSTRPDQISERDGDNAKIVLDALPSKYDFPALTSSVEKLLEGEGYIIESITGSDDEVAQAAVEAQSNPEPIEIPFGFQVKDTDYEGAEKLFKLMELSIRPFQVKEIEISAQGEESTLDVRVDALTYYQPAKIISITTKVVK